ncbi:MAG: hypothetical protein Q8S53_01370 [Brevundimonas sp.]|uniref:hypothetical protein n=1 Tax=Brevundimonas sp. TaxID=1871086 RepID=UPI00273565A3|nr:hypothetical protein [Brevundimonas sp.]MDP3376986.1 hypothetical protein [Brevundimonas sp.]
MTHFNPNDPDRDTVIVEPAPVYSETTETVIVRESNTGWWIAGILGGLVLLAVMFILFNRQAPQTDDQLLAAEVAAAQAEADARQAAVAGQIAGAQASVEVARANAARAEADARAAQARASEPVVIEREVVVPAPTPAPSGPAVVTTTTPQQ